MRKLYFLFTTFLFSFLVHAQTTHLVISQVYGGGGNASATYTNDFIEIFNPSTTAVNLSGYSVQYAAATGTTWAVTPLTNVSLQPGQYYLIQEAAGTTPSTALPAPDITGGTINLAAGSGKVALVNSTTALTGTCPTGAAIIDFVGYGSTATCAEPQATPAPAPGPSNNTTSVLRKSNGCQETDNNGADFATGATTPRNTASPINICSAAAQPILSAGTLAPFGNVCINTTSTSNSFTLTGSNLNGTNVVIGPLAGYTFSTADAGTYTNTLTIPSTGGNINQTVFVKLTPTTVQSYNGTIPVSGGGSSASVAVTGAGVNGAPAVSTGAATNVASTSATAAGTISISCSAVTEYGIEYSTTSNFTNGTGTKVLGSNLSGTDFTVPINGLAPGTAYFFKAFATNSGGTTYGTQQTFTTAVVLDPNSGVLKISQVYGGGGNAGAVYQNDFIEIFNPSANAVSLNGLSIQYAGATGASWDTTKLPNVLLQPGHYFLIQESSGGANGSLLPAPDWADNTPLAATAGKVALVASTNPLSGDCPVGALIIDLVGYGTTATCSETNPAPAPSATLSILRKNNGCIDTGNNSADFAALAPNPRNTTAPANNCAAAQPALTAGTLTPFGNVCVNTASSPNSFTLSGTNLNGSDITIGPLAGYTFSTTSGGTYTNTLVLSGYAGGAINQDVFVKLTPAAVQSYNGTITVTGGGAAASVAASGAGINTLPVVANGVAGTITTTSAIVSASITNNGCGSITAYGVEYSTNSAFAEGTGTKVAGSNLSGTDYSVGITGLTPNTNYYFRTFVTNAGGTVYGNAVQTFTTSVTVDPAANGLRISQVYGGGGNAGALFQNDFVEIFNPTDNAIKLNGLSVQYESGNGGGPFNVLPLVPAGTATDVILQPGQYYLVSGASAGAIGAPLPTPDVTSTVNLAATAGKVALVASTTALTGSCPTGATVIDFIGYGTASTVNCFEGSGQAPAPSATTSDLRKNGGCVETNNNAADFATGTPDPRNTSSPRNICSAAQPSLSATALTAFGNVCTGTTAGPNSFTITGTNLSAGNITVGPLDGFTFATTSGGTYAATLTIPVTGGNLSQQVFVKFAPTAVQSYNGTIPVGGGGAPSITVAASGAGINTATVTTGAAGNITTAGATLAGSLSTSGCSTFTAYGIEYSTTAGFVPGAGTRVAGSNLSGADFSVTLSGLAPNTTYYYRAYGTNGGGTISGTEQSFVTTVTVDPNFRLLKISQVYGGGGNTGAIYTNDFVELFNPSGNAINLAGLTLQYASATGSAWDTTKLPNVLLQPGHYFLIQQSSGGANGSPLPTPDWTDNTSLAATAGKVALVNSIVPLTVSCPLGATIIDLIGYGTTATCSETAPAPAPSALISDLRKNGGCIDTDNNSSDFVTGTPTPRNSATPANNCSLVQPSFTAGTLASFGNVCIAATSAANSFNLSGSNLNGTDVVVGPLSGYTFSATSAGTFTNTLVLSGYSGGTINQDVFVKLSPAAVQSYNGIIPVSGGGATANVTATGTGVNTPPAVTNGTTTVVNPSSATIAATITNAGCSPVTAYGVEYSTVTGFANGSGTKVAGSNLSGTDYSVTINGLAPNTTYYFKTFATNNGGTTYGTEQTVGTAVAVDPNTGRLVISQVYGGGGNAGAVYQNDFIEIFNPTNFTIKLNGLSVQYQSGNGTTTFSVTPLVAAGVTTDVLLQPGQYYLISEASGGTVGATLPTPDATGTINLAATAGKVALVNTTTPLTGSCAVPPAVIDIVGYGTTGASATVNCFEGAGPAPVPSAINSILRINGGCTDTNINSADFIAGEPTPRNRTSPLNKCPAEALLPIKLLNLKASDAATGIQLSFTNSFENEVANYILERSPNGLQYSAIAELHPRKNDGSQVDYTIVDTQPFVQVNYYRIKAIETSGRISYSVVVKINLALKATDIVIYPNPVKGNTLSYQVNNLQAGQYTIFIRNSIGQTISTHLIKHESGLLGETINIPPVSAGVYYLEMQGKTKLHRSFILQ